MTEVNVNVITEKTNIAETLPQHLLGQFCESENLNKFLGIFSSELQQLESDAVIPLLYQRTVQAAEGQQLDNIGEGLNILREGRDDEDYRAVLRASSLQRRGRGAIDEILDLLYYLTGIRLTHHYRGYGYYLQLGFNPTCTAESAIIDAVSRVLPMMSNVEWLRVPHDRVFGYTSIHADTRDHSYVTGHGSIHFPDAGGRMSSVIQRVDRDFANSDDPRYAFGYTSIHADSLSPNTDFIRGYQTIHRSKRTTTSAGELVSVTGGLSDSWNRLQDDLFKDTNTQD